MPSLIIALDMPTKAQNVALCANLAQTLKKSDLQNLYLKIGLRSFIRDGVAFVREMQSLNFRIFLDLKLYDIPNTMMDSLREIADLGVDIVTIHASAGRIVMSEIAKFTHSTKNTPLIFAVTALTSFDNGGFSEIYNCDIEKGVANLARIAAECKIDGIVCSPFESALVKEKFNLLTLTPAIRPVKSDFDDFGADFALDLPNPKDDQNRASTLSFALNQKSDFLVIGRPIYTHKSPALLTKFILQKLQNGDK
ncbi:orotidine-5'-phosphate decarboxylase [Helicobacter sp. 23-1045]